MADFTGTLITGLSDQAGTGDRYTSPGQSTNLYPRALPNTSFTGKLLFDTNSFAGALEATGEGSVDTPATYAGEILGGPWQFWFEIIHSLPQRLDLGNILAITIREIELYNAFREDTKSLTSATNNAGAGISFVGLPGLPADVAPQDGVVFDVQVTTSGPPSIDGTLDFVVSGFSISIPITGTRVVMFPYQPESPITETLQFLTDILQSTDGSEQRISIRKHPRQIFDFSLRVEEGDERRRLETLLYGWQSGIFGVPVWFEARYLGADITALDTVITVDTEYADFRDASLAIIWQDSETFDALEISSHTATTITFSSPVTKAYTAGQTLVMPLRVGVTESALTVNRYLVNLEDIIMRFRILDNEADIASDTGWPTHNSKVMLDESNMVNRATFPDNMDKKITLIDNQTASLTQFSDWPNSHYSTIKGFIGNSSQRIWEVRQLMHHLRGSQISFYLPTFFFDMIVVDDLASGSTLMDIENIGYTSYINGTEPNKSIRIELTDGTILTRQVLSAVVIDDTTERLTVDTSWASTITPAEVARVSLLRLSRIADDQVQFTHSYSGDADIFMSVAGVQQ